MKITGQFVHIFYFTHTQPFFMTLLFCYRIVFLVQVFFACLLQKIYREPFSIHRPKNKRAVLEVTVNITPLPLNTFVNDHPLVLRV
jgi:hypothetical protein